MLYGTVWLNIIIAFLVGGAWIALATLAADRFGSKIGGFIGGLPSTSIVAYFFIGLNQSPAQASEATTMFPLIMGYTGLFLVSFALLARARFASALAGALLLWSTLVLLTVLTQYRDFTGALIGYGAILSFCWLLLTKHLHLLSIAKGKIKYTKGQTLARGIFGGTVIACSVLLSKVGGPIFGAIFAAFPAVMISTLIISYHSQGLDFARSMTRPMLVTGMLTVPTYVVAVRYTYLSCGLIGGTILAFLIAMISAALTFRFILKKMT